MTDLGQGERPRFPSRLTPERRKREKRSKDGVGEMVTEKEKNLQHAVGLQVGRN